MRVINYLANIHCDVLLSRTLMTLCVLIRALTTNWISSLSKMGFVVKASIWTRYLNRKIQRGIKKNHKLKESTFMVNAQVVMQQRRRGIQRILGRPMLIDADVECGLQLSPLITASKAELSLIRLLDTYEMAKAMASECHHADFRSLMLVSKGVRFAAQNCMSSRILKRITCTVDHHRGAAANKVAPTDCWGCGNQICSGCASPRSIPQDKAFHLQRCFPFCSSCFRSRFCHSRNRKTGFYREWRSHWLPDICFGHGSRPIHPDIQFSGWLVPRSDLGKEFRDVCSLCKSMSWEEITARQGWMGWSQDGGRLGHQQATIIKCEGCEKDIPTSKGQKVWWGCRTCDSECVDEFHDNEFRSKCHGKPETGPAASAR